MIQRYKIISKQPNISVLFFKFFSKYFSDKKKGGNYLTTATPQKP